MGVGLGCTVLCNEKPGDPYPSLVLSMSLVHLDCCEILRGSDQQNFVYCDFTWKASIIFSKNQVGFRKEGMT